MLTPTNPDAHGMPYAIDNGAWSAHRRGVPWEPEPFLELCHRAGARADFVVLPDLVEGGRRSLRRSLAWLPFLLGTTRRLLIPVQDGLEPSDLQCLGDTVGLFVGGSTAWKLATLGRWGQLAGARGCYLHVGRVNTARRIARCAAVGAQSFDGTSVTRYAVTLPELEEARRQGGLRLYA